MGPRGLLLPLPLPSRRNGAIGVDWLLGLPIMMTAPGFDQVQAHVDRLPGRVRAVPTRATDAAADAARIVLGLALRSGGGILDMLVVDRDPKFAGALFKGFARRIGPGRCLTGSAASADHKNTDAKAERGNGVPGDTLRAFASGREGESRTAALVRRLRHFAAYTLAAT